VALLPADAQQHAVIRERLAELTVDRYDVLRWRDSRHREAALVAPRWPGLATGALLLVSKLKFLLLGLTKASTFVSMFAFFGVHGRSTDGRSRSGSSSPSTSTRWDTSRC
jgi:hypothetical protein